jgi:isopenicillin N synthase-like dioxygenase
MKIPSENHFDPEEKEAQLQRESQSWDTRQILSAEAGDIPIIDVSEYFRNPREDTLRPLAEQLKQACTEIGFFSLIGHQFPEDFLQKAFAEARRFHQLSIESKNTLLMDRADWPVKGVGYLPVKHRKLPARNKGNLNESFVIKRDHAATLDDNQWPAENDLPGFRKNIEYYAKEVEKLSKRLLPIYASALGLQGDFFTPAFTSPLYRMRLTHYPSVREKDADEYGIAPHVDTTFFTMLAQNSPGLVIYSEPRQRWIHAPVIDNAFIVNSGELLKQWTNDTFLSVKHFANNNAGDEPRYSIPFFFNANADYEMACIPTCCSDESPAKYPPITYLQSQGVTQGE